MTVAHALEHLWQSTLIAGAIALLALAFRGLPARTRYWMWLAASLKFLIPFAALTSLGARIPWRDRAAAARLEWTLAIEAVSQPFLAPPAAVACRLRRPARRRVPPSQNARRFSQPCRNSLACGSTRGARPLRSSSWIDEAAAKRQEEKCRAARFPA